jgi:hypothetical protein
LIEFVLHERVRVRARMVVRVRARMVVRVRARMVVRVKAIMKVKTRMRVRARMAVRVKAIMKVKTRMKLRMRILCFCKIFALRSFSSKFYCFKISSFDILFSRFFPSKNVLSRFR